MKQLLLLLIFSFALSSCSEGQSNPVYQYKAPAKDGLALRMGNISITLDEMNKGIESELYEGEQKLFEIKFNKLRTILMEKIMDSDPRKKGLSNDEYLEKFIVSKIKVSDKEMNDFIKERNIPKDQLTPELKERINNFILMQKKSEAVEKWLGEYSKKNPIEIFVEKPKRPTFNVDLKNSPILGQESAPVTIVEFSDFQCPYCAKASEIIHEVKKKYGNKVKVVFKQYPLPFHKDAKKAAVASLCANEQGGDKFWKLHDLMFKDQANLAINGLKEMAKKVGVKQSEFEACLDSDKYLAQVEEEIGQGQDIGVKSTPTFFVNGMLVSGAQPIEVFSEIIDSELK